MAWITSEDYVKFLIDVKDEEGNVIHKKGGYYPILNEDLKMGVYHIQQKRGTAQVTEFPKDVEGKVFEVL